MDNILNMNPVIEIVEIVAAVISVVACALAIMTERKVRGILESVSTKYVGKFPANMDEIIKLISSTKRRLIIMCDVPAYGHFSNPLGFAKYNLAIRNLLTSQMKPKITLITYNHDKRIGNSKNQFSDVSSYEQLIDRDTFKNYFDFHKDNKNIKPPEESTKQGFSNWLEEKHSTFLNDIAKIGVEVYESSVDLRLFVWISDDSAIFSFYNFGNDIREVSFRTNDQPLIEILRVIADSAKSNCTEFVIEK